MARNRPKTRSNQRTPSNHHAPSTKEAHPPTPAFEPYTRYAKVNQNGDLILQGRWLEKAGFPIGTAVDVRTEGNTLIIEAIKPTRTDESPPRTPHGTH